MNPASILENFGHPAVMFFFLGMIAIFVKSDLEIPPQIGKFLSIYLLFDIGIKGGEELFHSGFFPGRIIGYGGLRFGVLSHSLWHVPYPEKKVRSL